MYMIVAFAILGLALSTFCEWTNLFSTKAGNVLFYVVTAIACGVLAASFMSLAYRPTIIETEHFPIAGNVRTVETTTATFWRGTGSVHGQMQYQFEIQNADGSLQSVSVPTDSTLIYTMPGRDHQPTFTQSCKVLDKRSPWNNWSIQDSQRADCTYVLRVGRGAFDSSAT